MPKHKPIKFRDTLEPNLKKYVLRILKENPQAKSILNATLGIIATGGILTFGAVFPAILGEVVKIRRRQKRKSYEEYQEMWRSFNHLKRQRALNFIKEENGTLIYQVNENGKEKIKNSFLMK